MEAYLLNVVREGLMLALLLSAPPVLASLAAGVAVGALQAATQLQEPTRTLVPKIAAAALALVLASPWIGAQAIAFATIIFEGLPALAR